MKTFFRNILTRNTHRTLGLDGLRYDKFYVNNLASQAIKVTKIPKPKGGFRNIYIYCLRDRIEAQNIFDFIELNHLDKFIYPKVFILISGHIRNYCIVVFCIVRPHLVS